MKRMIAITVMLSALGATGAGAQTIQDRQRDQQRRINEGVATRTLTPAEAARLEREQAALNREIRRDRVDGGGLTPAERARINRQQDRLRREIFAEKHDWQGRR
jgi:hypothetical protein